MCEEEVLSLVVVIVHLEKGMLSYPIDLWAWRG